MDKVLLTLLREVDTPTVCNAIELAQGKRGFDAYTRGTPVASAPNEKSIVGYARTARIRGLQPPTESPDVIKQRRMDYYRYMSEGIQPSIAVVEDMDYPGCVSAFWGEINTTVHKGFGLAGALTNGVVRDLGDLPDDFPVIAGSVGPSHAFVHVLEFGTPVSVFDMRVEPDDLVHADRHGAVVIPSELLPKLDDAIRQLIATEKLILEPARKEGFDFAAFETAWTAFEKARV